MPNKDERSKGAKGQRMKRAIEQEDIKAEGAKEAEEA
jgi:hypothetical protein